MRRFLMTAALSAMVPLGAHAELLFSADVDGVAVLRCADNAGASSLCPGGDQNPAVGILQLQNGTFGGITLNGSVSESQGTPGNPGAPNILNTSSLNIINTTGSTAHIQAAAGDTSFTAPVGFFDASTSGVFQEAVGSTITTTFFDDALNRQGATDATDGPGSPLAGFSDTATLIADAFSHTASGPVSDTDPFSMTQLLDIMLTAGGQLVNRGSTEIKTPVPEPANTLGLLGIALIGMWAGIRRFGNVHAA